MDVTINTWVMHAPKEAPGISGIKLARDVAYQPGTIRLVKALAPSVAPVPLGRLEEHYAQAAAGQQHAEELLHHQEVIPEELRGNVLVFFGARWVKEAKDPELLFGYLFFVGGSWNLGFAHDIQLCHDNYLIALTY